MNAATAKSLSNIATLDSVAQNLDDDFFHQHVPRWPCNILSYPQSWWNGHPFFGSGDILYSTKSQLSNWSCRRYDMIRLSPPIIPCAFCISALLAMATLFVTLLICDDCATSTSGTCTVCKCESHVYVYEICRVKICIRSTINTWEFPKIGVPPNHPFQIGFSIINHPFWGTPIFGNTHISLNLLPFIVSFHPISC